MDEKIIKSHEIIAQETNLMKLWETRLRLLLEVETFLEPLSRSELAGHYNVIHFPLSPIVMENNESNDIYTSAYPTMTVTPASLASPHLGASIDTNRGLAGNYLAVSSLDSDPLATPRLGPGLGPGVGTGLGPVTALGLGPGIGFGVGFGSGLGSGSGVVSGVDTGSASPVGGGVYLLDPGAVIPSNATSSAVSGNNSPFKCSQKMGMVIRDRSVRGGLLSEVKAESKEGSNDSDADIRGHNTVGMNTTGNTIGNTVGNTIGSATDNIANTSYDTDNYGKVYSDVGINKNEEYTIKLSQLRELTSSDRSLAIALQSMNGREHILLKKAKVIVMDDHSPDDDPQECSPEYSQNMVTWTTLEVREMIIFLCIARH